MINFPHLEQCVRCRSALVEISAPQRSGKLDLKIFRRAFICLIVSLAALFGFYLSLIATSKPLAPEERRSVDAAVRLLDEKGFSREVFLLRYLSSFRANDNWLNASTRTETAYAATNYPFEIITIYPEFFAESQDDTERAAILLHEAQHLQGKDEPEAYAYVWQNLRKLGWTAQTHGDSFVWKNVRKQTREYAPELFVCEFKEFADCTDSGS